METLRYLFYRFYQLMVSVGNEDIAEYASILLMSMMFMLNAVTFFCFIHLLPWPKIYVGNISKVFGLSMFFGLIAILYSLLVYKGKYLEILKKYDEEPKEAKIKGRILIILYLIGSVGLLVFSFYLMMKKNRGEL